MKSSNSNTTSSYSSSDFDNVKNTDVTVYFVLALVALLSYGYEIFNFHLTIDEEMRGNQAGMWFDWISQGRWGMALANYFLVPNPIVPSTSIFLGVFGSILGILALIKSWFNMDRLGLTGVSALAISIPTLPFSFTYSTLAYGVGCGFIVLAIANWLALQKSVRSIILACLLAGFVIGIYQTFVFAVAMLALMQVSRFSSETKSRIFVSLKYPTLFILGSIVSYVLINIIVLKVMHVDFKYVGQFVDIHGFLQDPVTRFVDSFGRCIEIIGLHPIYFGIRSMWFGIIVLASLVLVTAYPLFRRNFWTFAWMVVIILCIIFLTVFADAIAVGGAPLRSVIYIPVGIAIIVACAYMESGKIGKLILISLCGLAVIGNSQVNNHLFASSASAEFRDRMLAVSIINEVRRLKPDNTSILKVEVIGNLKWPITGIQSKSETFGASFFEWDGGNRSRVAAYLGLNGLATVAASDVDRVQVYAIGKTMPSWPRAGWIQVTDDILILKFGDYSAPQRVSLCALKLTELCGNP